MQSKAACLLLQPSCKLAPILFPPYLLSPLLVGAWPQLLSEGVRLVREGRGARFSSVWNTMSSRGGGADTPRSGDQDAFGSW
jgi:hypothetical protein